MNRQRAVTVSWGMGTGFAIALTFALGHAAAAPTVDAVGSYKIALKEVQNSCSGTGVSMDENTVEIAKSGRGIRLSVKGLPDMKGRAGKGGKFQANAKKGKTAIAGLDGAFSAAGRVKADGKIQFVLIAEFYKGKRPFCTQSWNAKGTRSKLLGTRSKQ